MVVQFKKMEGFAHQSLSVLLWVVGKQGVEVVPSWVIKIKVVSIFLRTKVAAYRPYTVVLANAYVFVWL